MNSCRVFCLANNKGGVAKTATTTSLATLLALAGHRILVIDFDPQANATQGLGCYSNGKTDIFDVLLKDRPVEDAVVASPYGVDILANMKNTTRPLDIFRQQGKENLTLLRNVINSIKDRYDEIFIDTNPSANLLSDMAMIASDYILIPVKQDSSSIDGIYDELQTIKYIKENYNNKLEIKGIFLANVNTRTNLVKIRFDQYTKAFGSQFKPIAIREDNTYSMANASLKPLYFYQKKSNVGNDYIELAQQLGLLSLREFEKLDSDGYVKHTEER